jgi:SAM-dependent methyltransferase
MTYNGLEGSHDTESPHLGGSIKGGDPFTWSPRAWDYLISRFGITSVMDVGSGPGNAALYFFRKGLQVLAVEGHLPSIETSLYPAIAVDLTKTAVKTRVDLVHCVEVVEHIEEEHLSNILDTLFTGRIIVMTHAVPGQVGYHHVNCQPPEYWISKLAERNGALLEEDTARVRALADQDGAIYLRQTGMVFANRLRL